MPEPTTPQLSESEVADIECVWIGGGEVSDERIGALIRDWRALTAQLSVATDMAVLSGYESGLADAATQMRDKCVRAVRAYLTDCRDEERGIIEAIALELESLTLDQVEQETK